MNRETEFERIRVLLARFGEEVKIANSNGEFSINIHAENVLLKILNVAYDLNLVNVNYEEGKTFPAIDLKDEVNRVSFQITASGTADKVVDCLNKFNKNGMGSQYDDLYFYFLKEMEDGLSVNKSRIKRALGSLTEDRIHFLDHGLFYNYLNSLSDNEKIHQIHNLLEAEFADPPRGNHEDTATNPQTSAVDISSDAFWENSIRKLADGLYINWKTGCLSQDFAHARKGSEDETCVWLSAAQLRLLSLLVQGEGAVVSRRELNDRQRVMQGEENRGGKADLEEADAEEADAGKAVGKKADKAKTLEEQLEDLRNAFCRISPALGDMIEAHRKDESGKGSIDGYRIKLAPENPTRDLYADYGCSSDDDWDILADNWDSEKERVRCGKNKKEFKQAFLRRHYQKVCNSFGNKISNARNDADGGKRIFGAYKMAQLYTNAYAKTQYEDETEAMLDFVEKWFVGEYDVRISSEKRSKDRIKPEEKYGRVMVLHGQPGDGKTTFCKKAVYAHCKEGWLGEAKQVLLVSLNPNDSGREILSSDKNVLNLRKALCLTQGVGDDEDRYFCKPSDLDGALVIFDGYDELAGDLRSANPSASFWDFCRKVKELAKPENGEYAWNAIITSRTMCIKDEMEERGKTESESVTVASFAPLTEEQQDAMIDRMIQINEENGIIEDDDAAENDGITDNNDITAEKVLDGKSATTGKCSLKQYKKYYLPKLRKLQFSKNESEEFNEILKIPSLFRMIVTRRFRETEGAENVAGLFTRLVEQLFTYKRAGKNEAKEAQKNAELIRKYEDIAARIFQDNEDTCSYREGEIEEDSELIYAFLTKDDAHETGRLGFLHGMFRQYFLARYIISLLEGRGTEAGTDDREKVYAELLSTMRARQISEPFVWQMVEQFAELERKRLSQSHLKELLAWLDNTDHFAEVLKSRPLPENSDAEKDDLRAARIAVFNLISCLAHVENVFAFTYGESAEKDNVGKRDTKCSGEENGDAEKIAYRNYPNVCRLLCLGNYPRIYLAGLNLGGCNFTGAHFAYADLRGANLERTDLIGAQLEGALFMGAKLIKTALVGTSLSRAQFSDIRNVRISAQFQIGSGKNETDLSGAFLMKANLERANLRGVEMKGADFQEAILVGANLADAKAKVTCWNNANLKGAFLRGLHLEGSSLKWTCLEEAYMCGAHLEGAHLEHSRLVGAYLESANLGNTYLDQASLRAAYLDDAKIEAASMKGADLTDAFLTEKQYELIKNHQVFGLASAIPSGIVNGVDLKAIEGTRQTFCFGRYPQEERDRDDEIKWRVLKCGYDRALVISEDLLDCQKYNRTYENVTWETSWLREWLNKVFVFKAFDEEEIAKVAEVRNQNLDNFMYNTDGGRATWDRVFALSMEEAERFFADDMDRRAYVTPFAHDPGDRKYGAHKNYRRETQDGRAGTGWWWLRSPGDDSRSAAGVGIDGGVDADGDVDYGYVSVRPAFWLHL